MNELSLARQYLDCFFGKRPLDDMRELLADDLIFSGPFHQSTNADSYFKALLADPPVGVSYNILYEFEKDGVVCIIYEFNKAGVNTTMSQVFEVNNSKINKIVLVFDTSVFKP
jgi:hypothetical protein